jgi:hypothetical protein
MKKGFSIFISALILISGMHLSMASHLCMGEMVAVKWSFTGKLAGCGMETPVKSCPVHEGFAKNCCQNKITYFSVDNNYVPSTLDVKDVVRKLVNTFEFPVYNFSSSILPPSLLSENFSPPGNYAANEVSLAGICVFRI